MLRKKQVGKRKIIFECKTGSILYGTSLPSSDVDFKGVFIPDPDDELNVFNARDKKKNHVWDLSIKDKDENGKNTENAVDREMFSLPFFIHNILEGQPWALEMLFVPDDMIVTKTSEWDEILAQKQIFLSTRIGGFYGFAKSQADRATLKGERLSLVRKMISALNVIENSKVPLRIRDFLDDRGDGTAVFNYADHMIVLDTVKSKSDAPLVKIAGRDFDYGMTLKSLRGALTNMESSYGERVKTAADDGYDWKSLYHAYRLISEAEEFLHTGNITLPRPDADFLLKIRNKASGDHREELNKGCERIRAAENISNLPHRPNTEAIAKLCCDLIYKHTVGE